MRIAPRTTARFRDREALERWRSHPDHVLVQGKGRDAYYARYEVEVLDTVRAYEFSREKGRAVRA